MWRSIDTVLRFAYVLLAPVILMAFAAIVPMGPIVITTALATGIALGGSERWKQRVARLKWIGRPLGGFARLGDYYREHPPRPLIYYLLYPALFPYWLFNKPARREFLLYRRLSALTLVIIVGGGIVDYVRNWRPIPFAFFVSSSVATFVIQLLVTFVVVMPIVTTVITLHQREKRKSLIVLLLGALLIGGLSYARLETSRLYPIGVVTRVRARSSVEHEAAGKIAGEALHAAVLAYQNGGDDAAALVAARDKLAEIYRPDEAATFRLYHDARVTMLFAKFNKFEPIWIAHDDKRFIARPEQLPPGARLLIGK